MSTAAPGTYARKAQRFAPQTPMPVVDAMSADLIGFVMDLSAGGMKLMAGKPLVDDALYQVQFELHPDKVEREPIEAGVQVVSQRKNADGSAVVGLRFIHVPGLQAIQIGKWLQARMA